MLIFREKNLLFFFTPKTASTSFDMALRAHAFDGAPFESVPKHIPPHAFFSRFSHELEDCFTETPESLSLIREPIDWVESWYRYRQRPEIKDPKKSTAGMSFDAFVENYLSDAPDAFADIGQQFNFLRIMKTDRPLSYLWRYDAIADLEVFLNLRLGIDFKLGRFNASPKAETMLSPMLRTELKAKLAEDFELYEQAISAE